MRRASGVALLGITIMAVAVMWQPAYWAITLPSVAVFCLAAIWLVRFLLKNAEIHSDPAFVIVVVAALWPLAQLAAGIPIYRWQTSVSFLYWAAAAATVFVGLQCFRDPGVLRFYLRALVIFGLVMAVVAPLQRFTSDGKIFWLFDVRYSNIALGPFVYPNQYAAFMELSLPIALTEAFADRSGWRTLHGLAALVIYASVIASGSRTGFVLTTIEVLVVPLLAARRAEMPLRQFVKPAAVFLGMLLILALAMGPEILIDKLQQKDPYRGRREFVESSARMIQDRPIVGVGMGNWATTYPAYAVFDDGMFANQAHNDWAQWAVEGGIPFALLILGLAVWIVPKAIRTGWGTGLGAIFLQCLVDYPIQRIAVAFVFFTILAAVCAAEGRRIGSSPARN